MASGTKRRYPEWGSGGERAPRGQLAGFDLLAWLLLAFPRGGASVGVEVRRGAGRQYQLVPGLGDGPTRRSSTVTPTTRRGSSAPRTSAIGPPDPCRRSQGRSRGQLSMKGFTDARV